MYIVCIALQYVLTLCVRARVLRACIVLNINNLHILIYCVFGII